MKQKKHIFITQKSTVDRTGFLNLLEYIVLSYTYNLVVYIYGLVFSFYLSIRTRRVSRKGNDFQYIAIELKMINLKTFQFLYSSISTVVCVLFFFTVTWCSAVADSYSIQTFVGTGNAIN